MAATERDYRNRLEQMRIDHEQELFKIKQENYILSAKVRMLYFVLFILSYFTFKLKTRNHFFGSKPLITLIIIITINFYCTNILEENRAQWPI